MKVNSRLLTPRIQRWAALSLIRQINKHQATLAWEMSTSNSVYLFRAVVDECLQGRDQNMKKKNARSIKPIPISSSSALSSPVNQTDTAHFQSTIITINQINNFHSANSSIINTSQNAVHHHHRSHHDPRFGSPCHCRPEC